MTKELDEYVMVKLKEFDTIFIHNNLWRSDDEKSAYVSIDGMRQWVFDSLHGAIIKTQEKDRMKFIKLTQALLTKFKQLSPENAK